MKSSILFLLTCLLVVIACFGNCVSGYVLYRDFLPIAWSPVNDDYPQYDSFELDDITTNLADEENKDVEVMNVDCATEFGHDENEMPNELPVLRESSREDNEVIKNSIEEIEVDKSNEEQKPTTTEKPVVTREKNSYFSSSEITELLDSLSDILTGKVNSEEDSFMSGIFNDDDLTEAGEDSSNPENVAIVVAGGEDGNGYQDEAAILIIGFGNDVKSRDSSNEVSSDELSVNINTAAMALADFMQNDENVPDDSVEWLDDNTSNAHKVVEDGYIFYDMVVSSSLSNSVSVSTNGTNPIQEESIINVPARKKVTRTCSNGERPDSNGHCRTVW